jgi:hypothetical protein
MRTANLLRIVMLALLVASLSPRRLNGQGAPAQQSEELAKQEALKVDDAFNRAVMEKDIAALDQILANKLSWVARGDRLDKAQVLADFKSENLHFKSLTHDGLILNVFGNTVIVTGHSTSVLEYKGKLSTTPRLFTTVYMKLDGRWQLVAHQVSDVVEK